MLLRSEEHGLQPPARPLVLLGPRGDRGAHGPEVVEQRVALGLQRGQAQQPRPAARPAVRGDRRAVEDGRRDVALEPGDLRAQVGPRRSALLARGADDRDGLGERAHGQPPIGALGFAPQNTCVPSIPMRWTRTMLRTIDLAVAVPTPTGPPEAW